MGAVIDLRGACETRKTADVGNEYYYLFSHSEDLLMKDRKLLFGNGRIENYMTCPPKTGPGF